jgi:integrase/recombinase XerD
MNKNAVQLSELALEQPRPASKNPAVVYLASLPSEGSRATQRQALRIVAQVVGIDPEFIDWGKMRNEHTSFIRARLMEHYGPASVNKILSALRQTLKRAWLMDQMTVDEYGKAVNLDKVVGETLPRGRGLAQGEILTMMMNCQGDKNKPLGTRDAAIIGLMYAAGLRRGDVVSANMENVDTETWEIKLLGKRHKEREVYVRGGALDALQEWLNFRGQDDGPLFLAVSKSGNIHGERLSTQAIYNMLLRRAAECGVKHFSPHDLRRSFISDLLDKGADISTVAKMAGHQNVQTTQRYDRRPKQAMEKAAELLHVPYKKSSLDYGAEE